MRLILPLGVHGGVWKGQPGMGQGVRVFWGLPHAKVRGRPKLGRVGFEQEDLALMEPMMPGVRRERQAPELITVQRQ